MSDTTDRRQFLGTAMSGLVAGAGMRGIVPEPQIDTEPWLVGMVGKGTHRQFFDAGNLDDGKPLRRVDNFLTAYQSAYHLPESEIKVLFGAHGDGLGFVLSDALWMRFHLGELFLVTDPATRSHALRNVFNVHGTGTTSLTEAQTISGLMQRGVRFLACMNSVSSLAGRLAAQGAGSVDSLIRNIVAGLLPGVMPVPAMLVAGNRAQESGFTYAWLA